MSGLGLAAGDQDVPWESTVAPRLVELRHVVDEAPARFGGFYIDHSHGLEVVIQVTSNATGSDRNKALAALPADVPTRFVSVAHSLGQLRAAHQVLDGLLGRHDRMVYGVTGVGRTPSTNMIEVQTLPDRAEALGPAIRQLVDPDLVFFTTGGYDHGTVCNDRDDCWDDPIRGGLHISPDGCTAGFTVWSDDPNKFRLLSAGHCYDEDSSTVRYHNGSSHELGMSLKNSFYDGSSSDFAMLSLAGVQGWSDDHRVYRSSGYPTWPMEDIGFAVEGTHVCQSGRVSGNACGYITTEYWTSVRDDGLGGATYTIYGQQKADYDWAYGDSGGPVYLYQGHIAYGLQVACAGTCGASSRAVISPIDYLWGARDGGPSGDPFHAFVCTTENEGSADHC